MAALPVRKNHGTRQNAANVYSQEKLPDRAVCAHSLHSPPVLAAFGFRRRAVFGASAVESRSTRLVRSMYSLPVGDGDLRRTSVRSALNARRAISACDIFTVVKGGITNWARRMSSNPTTESSLGT